MEHTTETYSFSQIDELGITTTLTYSVPAVGTTLSTFVEMCQRAAQAFGYGDSAIEREFGGEQSYEPFDEFFDEED